MGGHRQGFESSVGLTRFSARSVRQNRHCANPLLDEAEVFPGNSDGRDPNLAASAAWESAAAFPIANPPVSVDQLITGCDVGCVGALITGGASGWVEQGQGYLCEVRSGGNLHHASATNAAKAE